MVNKKDNKVGAGILNIITESLYDNPIVVFREYVQNSMDSLLKSKIGTEEGEIRIWSEDSDLFFLDNGEGIKPENFKDEMIKIGASTKKRQKDIGYKGIGRLSGVPYCQKLWFLNIYDYAHMKAQIYKIDSEEYNRIKNEEDSSELSFEALMDRIGSYEEIENIDDDIVIYQKLQGHNDILKKSNSGFMVFLENISLVLNNTIKEKNFLDELGWLLPVDFQEDLYKYEEELFNELTQRQSDKEALDHKQDEETVPVRFCKIYYNNNQIFRPIQEGMLRDYVGKINFISDNDNKFKYAVGFHTFKLNKIAIDKKNPFSGIRIYIDNMLLCDENELLQSLDHYGMLAHTLNGQLQSVRGIGAMIYITDKVNISANARRTFIEVTDNDSLEFLRMLAEFVNIIYDARYALSNYMSARGKLPAGDNRLSELETKALKDVRKLANGDVELKVDEDAVSEFSNMTKSDKKKVIKGAISKKLDLKLKEYLKELEVFEPENAYQQFLVWLNKKHV
ncbi:MAG: ATP-binding protein [Clostridiales bacterium]|nr:ATP-binding protein [Clostridiales bacterium]